MSELGKRLKPLVCKLLLQDEMRKFKVEGSGEVRVEKVQNKNFLVFENEDGSEFCWKFEEDKRFVFLNQKIIQFYCEAEEVHRAFKMESPEQASELWNQIMLLTGRDYGELQSETSNQLGGKTPTSSRSFLQEAASMTSLEAMAATKFKPENLEAILELIRDRGDAVIELLSSNAQMSSLESTFNILKERLEDKASVEHKDRSNMKTLVLIIQEIRRLSLLVFNLEGYYSLLALLGGNTWELTFSILSHHQALGGVPIDFTDLKKPTVKLMELFPFDRTELESKLELARKMLFLKDNIVTHLSDFKLEQKLKYNISVALLEVLQHILNSPPAINSWVQKLRKPTLESFILLQEVVDFLGQNIGVIECAVSIKESFKRLIKEYKLLTCMKSHLESYHYQRLQAGQNPVMNASTTSTQVVTEQIAQRIVNVLKGISEGFPQIMWEFCNSEFKALQKSNFVDFLLRTMSDSEPQMREDLSTMLHNIVDPREANKLRGEQKAINELFLENFFKAYYQPLFERALEKVQPDEHDWNIVLCCLKSREGAGASLVMKQVGVADNLQAHSNLKRLVGCLSTVKYKILAHKIVCVLAELVDKADLSWQDTLVEPLCFVISHFSHKICSGVIKALLCKVALTLCMNNMTKTILEILDHFDSTPACAKLQEVFSFLKRYSSLHNSSASPEEITRNFKRVLPQIEKPPPHLSESGLKPSKKPSWLVAADLEDEAQIFESFTSASS